MYKRRVFQTLMTLGVNSNISGTQSRKKSGIIDVSQHPESRRRRMKNTDIRNIVNKQRRFFHTGVSLDVKWRLQQLKKLKASIQSHEAEIQQALKEDLGRTETEGYLCDILPTLLEIDETIHGLRKWAKAETHYSGILCFPSMVTKVRKLPYGVCLIISPFNFPFLLSLGVLAAAIAGGNTAVLKTSSKSNASTKVIKKIIESIFEEEYVTVVEGGHEAAEACLDQRFDKIFYTGSPRVAAHVLEKAAVNLTPVGLELGGETGNWCIVRKDADLKDAARKIAFVKILNAGQVCININQVAVAEEVAETFLGLLKEELVRQIGKEAHKNGEYPRLITRDAYDRCSKTAEQYRDRIIFGGKGSPELCKYGPTVIYPVGIGEKAVQQELFNPLLPIVPYKDSEIDELLETIEQREHGLALYMFTKDKKWAEQVMSGMQFGGGCINDVIMHLMVKGVPFNGTGHSGMGAYHGKWGFEEFTHPQTVLVGSSRLNLPLREHPYTGKEGEGKNRMLRWLGRMLT